MALTDKLTAVADAIRGKTGKAEPLTLDQMPGEIAGIAAGGASGIYMAKITPAEYLGALTITHNLGTTDILYVAAWAETLGEFIPENPATLCKMWAKTDITTRRGGNGFSTGYSWNVSSSYADPSSPNMGSYETLAVLDANTVKLDRTQSGSTNGYHAGITYTVLVIAANAEV